MIHLIDGVVCSKDTLGNILTWEAHTNEILSRFKVEEYSRSLLQLSDTQVAVVDGTNGIILLKHDRGKHVA